MATGRNEAFSRVLIDHALEDSEWDLLDPQQVLFELHTPNGRADYLLKESLDDKRTPIEANDIPDVLARWEKREEGPNSYRVPIEKIRENDWSLAAGRYKPVTAVAVNHDAPADILEDVLKLEKQIVSKSDALRKQLGGKP
jgi:type I restriction-modification system DNA methylase subunit